MKPISQYEARRLRKRVKELESHIQSEHDRFSTTWPGVKLGAVSWNEDCHTASAVYTARQLGHAIVAVPSGTKVFNLYAVPQTRP